MNNRGVILSGLIYVLLVFFLLLIGSLVLLMWHRHNGVLKIKEDANTMFEEVRIRNF